jgi:hypothetical protein
LRALKGACSVTKNQTLAMLQCNAAADLACITAPKRVVNLIFYACFSELEQDVSVAILHQPRVIKMA